MSGPHITPEGLDELVERAKESPRRRQHLNLHASPDEPCQRLLNAVEPGSYIRPHRHSNYQTNECLLALRGAFALVIFDDGGRIQSIHRFGRVEGNLVVVELRPFCWHTVIALESGSVLFEAKSGPFDAHRGKDLAPWAPAEGAPEAADYLASLHAAVEQRRTGGRAGEDD